MSTAGPIRPVVVKIGGSTLGSHDTTLEDLVSLQRSGQRTVVVHGGGKVITDWLTRLGTPTRFVRGLRVTDEAALEVVTATLAGLLNKQLVADIQRLGGRAVGLSGADGGVLQARVDDRELGLVGHVDAVDCAVVEAILSAGYLPVIAPLGLDRDGASSSTHGLLNLNADTVAGEIAFALGARELAFLTDVPGVQDGNGQLCPELTVAEANALIASGVASGGMIPKLEACLRALESVSATLILDGRRSHVLLEGADERGGTRIVKGKEDGAVGRATLDATGFH